GLLAVLGGDDRVATLLQQFGDGAAGVGVVIDDEDRRGGRSLRRRRSRSSDGQGGDVSRHGAPELLYTFRADPKVTAITEESVTVTLSGLRWCLSGDAQHLGPPDLPGREL